MDIFPCEFCGDYMGEGDTMPRVLRCGHTFCTPCVSEFFGGGEYKCPTCNRHLHSKYFSSIPVNHALLKVIKAKMSSGDKNVKELMILPAISSKKNAKHSDDVDESQSILHDYEIETAPSPNEPPQHAGKCITHDAYCLFWCKSCKEWICEYCFVTAHPPLVCEISHFDHALHEIKLEGDQCIKKTIKLFDNHADKYSKKKSVLKEKRENNRALIKEIQTLLLKHQEANRDIERQTEAIKSTLADGLSSLLSLLESQRQLLEAQTSKDVFSARHQAQVCQRKILDWHDPNNLLLNEEIAYSDELQKSTFTAIAVLKDLLSSSDNNDFESQTSGLTTLSKKDEDAVARNLKHLLENSEWKDIIAKIENHQFSSDNSLHCLANISRRSDFRKYDLEKGLHEAYVMQHRQMEAKATTCGKFEVPNENLIDLTSDEREFRVQCPLPEKQYLTPDSKKQLEYHSMNTYISAKRKPQLEGISETEEPLEILTWKHAWQEEEEQNETGKLVVAKGKDDDQAQQLVKGIRLLEDGYENPRQIILKSHGFKEIDFANEGTVKGDQSGVESEIDREHNIKSKVHDKLYTTDICDSSKDPSKTLSVVSKVKHIYAKVEENFHENFLPKDSKNELHLLDGSFDNDVSQSKTGKKCDDPQNFRVCSPASKVGIEYGCDGRSELGRVGSTVSKGNTIAVSGVGHIVSGEVIVVASEKDEDDNDDDDVDDDNFSTNDYKCDIILPLEGKEIYEIRRTEQRLETGDILLEGEYGSDREAFIQDSNNEENSVALCKDKGLVPDKDSKMGSDLISWCDVHTDEETITMSIGYQTEDVIATDRHYHTKETDQTESDHSDEFFLTPTTEFGVEHCPIGHNDSVVSSEKEPGEIETAYGIENDTTVAIDDLDESQRYMICIIPESNGDNATQITCSEVLEDNVENTDADRNGSRIGDRCRMM